MHIDFDKFQASLDDIGEEQTAINEYKLLRARDVLIVAQRNLRHMAIELDALLINYMRANACDIAISDTERLYVGTSSLVSTLKHLPNASSPISARTAPCFHGWLASMPPSPVVSSSRLPLPASMIAISMP